MFYHSPGQTRIICWRTSILICFTRVHKVYFTLFLTSWHLNEIGKVGRDVVKNLIIKVILDNQSFSCLIIKLYKHLRETVTSPWLSRSVILPKTRLKGLILIIKSTYQPWYVTLSWTKDTNYKELHTPPRRTHGYIIVWSRKGKNRTNTIYANKCGLAAIIWSDGKYTTDEVPSTFNVSTIHKHS